MWQNLARFLEGIMDLIVNLVQGLVNLFVLISKSVVYLVEFSGYLPSFLIPVFVACVSVAVVRLIAGRN